MIYNDYFTYDKKLWSNWKVHRDFISKVILDKIICKNSDVKSIAIFGAGFCNDIDLNFFTNNFDIVTLLDINKESMEKGIQMQDLSSEELSKINTIGGFDFVGQSQDIYSDFEKLLINKTPIKKIKKFIRDKARLVNSIDVKIPEMENHSVVISVGVHSQLSIGFNLLISKYMNYYTRKELLDLESELRYYNTLLAKKFNDILIDYADIALFSGYDAIEISKERNNQFLLPRVIDLVKNADVRKLSELMLSNGVTGAIQGFCDINQRLLDKGKVYHEYYNKGKIALNFWIWTFNENKVYVIFATTAFKECF